MTSILTNTSAMAALKTLRSINKQLAETQQRLATGYRINKASDNPAYWSIATTMRSDDKALSAVQDALGLGAAKLDTAYAAMDSAISVVDEIKAKIVAATEKGVDKAKIQDEISQLQSQLLSIAQSASFAGENWLVGGNSTKNVISSFVRDASNGVSVKTTDYALDSSTSGNVLFGLNTSGMIDTSSGLLGSSIVGSYGGVSIIMPSIFSIDVTNMSLGDLQVALQGVDLTIGKMTDAASKLGSMQKRIDMQQNFVSDLRDSIQSGIGRLVDANMEEEATRLAALQTQQQLAIQALSIANASTQNILILFRR
ncbi:flagellin [Rhizobium sp. BK512]|uniref:flagellin N-terminal helical domain-containing protein n=1 Tax=Rhizobium sp. BK512 TaxID=2587010 RepID=UPI000DE0FDF6|nr:flagellin [Rhizobium sp. BK512]MBB3560647.1 flagellin [Rhizobium sp. BK512]